MFLVSKIVPLTIIKGAGHEHIPIPEGETAIIADFHTIQTQTKASPAYLTTGFYRVVPGPTRYGDYDYEETKYVLRGQIDVTDEATGITHHLVAGDWAFFHVGSKAQFSTKSEGVAFYAVTRPANNTPHVNLKGREESTSKL
ncbi:Cupin_3 domain-containing protein [Fusarium acuminatum]|uniref:Cupin_3 domain-containing protein n=1 Tax=Fusarium acuminatum TaxID=5515 RepID=A0ABZ2XCC0_9HYPO